MSSREPLVVRARVQWSAVAVLLGCLPVLLVFMWLATFHETGGRQFLPLLVLLAIVSVWTVVRLPFAALGITADGRLRRQVWLTREVELDRLRTVAVNPSLPRPDLWTYGRLHNFDYELIDDRGVRVQIRRRGAQTPMFLDTEPVLEQIRTRVTGAAPLVSVACWEALHEDLGGEVPPYPAAWTYPDDGRWGVRAAPRTTSRATQRTYWRFFLLAPVGSGLVASLQADLGDPVLAVTPLVGGLVATGLGWGYLAAVARADRREYVTITRDGRLEGVRRTSRWRLGLQAQTIDLRRLTQVEVVPQGKVERDGRPGSWGLRLRADTGEEARFDLLHEYAPDGVFTPQLVHHVEARGLPLDAATHRALSLRLGRDLTNPVVEDA